MMKKTLKKYSDNFLIFLLLFGAFIATVGVITIVFISSVIKCYSEGE